MDTSNGFLAASIRWSKHALLALAVVYAGESLDLWPPIEAGRFEAFASLMAQVAATMMGFVIATIAILTTFGTFRVGRNLFRTGRVLTLLRLLSLTAAAFAMVTAIGAAISLWGAAPMTIWPPVLLFTILWACLLLCDAVYKLYRVVSVLDIT